MPFADTPTLKVAYEIRGPPNDFRSWPFRDLARCPLFARYRSRADSGKPTGQQIYGFTA
jgi:hypothetical protein